MLNERLEKYLHDQTMKEFSSSKLFAGEIWYFICFNWSTLFYETIINFNRVEKI